jgi:NADH:ubiquinone oxidoreductase subunit F (NADH-binding)
MVPYNKETLESLYAGAASGQDAWIRVGMSTCGLAAGAGAVFDALVKSGARTQGAVAVRKAGCLGCCWAEPTVEVKSPGKDPVIYANVDEEKARRIFSAHFEQNQQAEEKRIAIGEKEYRIVLRNCGRIDPEKIEEYCACDGYRALSKTIFDLSPEKVIEELKLSGLRGRGGAGFPTWLKWNLTRAEKTEDKYVICNGDEGDPGAYMDRSVLEGDPHSIIEGMAIAGYAIGARTGYVYIRAEYPIAIERMTRAIEQAKRFGFLGNGILGSSFSFDLEIRLGAGAFVCGEETALIASIEGKRGTPKPRPPFPSVSGLWNKPTSINNVETFANIAPIILRGGAWFAGIGTEKSKGTKVFALTGKISRTGLVEIPMGTPLEMIVYEIGGGTISGKAVKAVQTGGPSGGVIPRKFFSTPVSYEHLQELGSIMGSGGMIVMDEDDCLVDIAKFYLGFCVDESCGKCAPCRIGGKQMLAVLNAVCEGRAQEKDIDKIKRLAATMGKASLCGLGQTAPNPVLSTLKYFEEEYRSHISGKRCPAGVCAALLSYTILQDKCRRCGLCFRECPTQAVKGDRKEGYTIAAAACIKCGRCFDVCKFDAVQRN